MNYYPIIDSDGFYNGTMAEMAIGKNNESVVIRTPLPEQPLGLYQQWWWNGSNWTAVTDNRGRSWYDPNDTDRVFRANRPNDTPPPGWAEWLPGQNRVITQAELLSKQWAKVRKQRAALLAQSDWTMLSDSTVTGSARAQWSAYRQSLRDITKQPDPFNIQWPLLPT